MILFGKDRNLRLGIRLGILVKKCNSGFERVHSEKQPVDKAWFQEQAVDLLYFSVSLLQTAAAYG